MPRLHIKQNGKWEPVGKDHTDQPLKAVVCFDQQGNILGETLNITSISKYDTGYWQHNFETTPPDGFYCAIFTSDYNANTSRNDVCQIIRGSYDISDGLGDYCRTLTTLYNDNRQNCERQSLRVYW